MRDILVRDIVTQRMKLQDIYLYAGMEEGNKAVALERGKQFSKSINHDAEESFVRKFLVGRRIKELDKDEQGERRIKSVITDQTIDRDTERIISQGAKLEWFAKNPVVLQGHDYRSLPIAKAVKVTVHKTKVIGIAEYARTAAAEDVYQLKIGEFMKAVSIGFIPIKTKRYEKPKDSEPYLDYLEWELLEWSDVAVPCNPNALMASVKSKSIFLMTESVPQMLGFETEVEQDTGCIIIREPDDGPVKCAGCGKCDGKANMVTCSKCGKTFDYDKETEAGMGYIKCPGCQALMNQEGNIPGKGKEKDVDFTDVMRKQGIEDKAVIPYKKTPLAPPDSPWNASREIREATVSDLKIMCTLFDPENADAKTSYKLPHHLHSGQHSCIWRGVSAAMGVVLGARGGVDGPLSERKGAHGHLAKHYKEFDKKVPDFKEMDSIVIEALTCIKTSIPNELSDGGFIVSPDFKNDMVDLYCDQEKWAEATKVKEKPAKGITINTAPKKGVVIDVKKENDQDRDKALDVAAAGIADRVKAARKSDVSRAVDEALKYQLGKVE